MIDVLGFVRNLEAGVAHAKVHGVHVDLPGVGLVCRCLEGSVDVFVDGRQDLDLLLSSLANRLGQAEEAGVGACGKLWDELRLSAWIGFSDASRISPIDFCTHLRI